MRSDDALLGPNDHVLDRIGQMTGAWVRNGTGNMRDAVAVMRHAGAEIERLSAIVSEVSDAVYGFETGDAQEIIDRVRRAVHEKAAARAGEVQS